MVLDIIIKIIFSIVDLLKGTIIFTIPIFVLVLISIYVRKRIAEKFKLNWFLSAAVITYILLFIITFVFYFLPFVSSLWETQIGTIPEAFANSFLEMAVSTLFVLIRHILVVAVLTILVLPLEFVGVFLLEKFEENWPKGGYLNVLIATFLMVLITAVIVLFIIPWSWVGVFFLIFFSL
ncbi:MAG: hypothetical protein ABID38_04585 [Candidatus Diapherotrites archaeon]